jgi:hypothetical protein
MSLEGSIKDFGLSDIFQLIFVQQKSGLMTIEHQSRRATVGFVKGMLVSAQIDGEEGMERIGEVLVRAKRLTPQQLEAALKTQQEAGEYLGQVLIGRKFVSEADLKRALRLQILEAVYRLFRWKDGEYRFDQKDVDYPRNLVDPISTEHILMEGVRRLDEWPYIERKISSLTMVFARVPERRHELEAQSPPSSPAKADTATGTEDDPFADLDTGEQGRFSEMEVAVYHAVNGVDNVDRMIQLLETGEFEVCKALSNLVTAGLIVPVGGPSAQVPSASSRVLPALRMGLAEAGRWLANAALLLIVLAAPILIARQDGGRMRSILADDLQAVNALTVANQVAGLRELVHMWVFEHGGVPDSLTAPITAYGGSWPLTDPWGRTWRYDAQTGDVSSLGADGLADTPDDVR